MKMLKKMTCLALALIMLLTACAFAESNEDNFFTPNLANSFDASTQEWFSTSYNRALLTILLILDCDKTLVEKGLLDSSGSITRSSFVGLTDDILAVYYHCVDGDLMILYSATAGIANYTVLASHGESTATSYMDVICEGNYYLNSLDDITDIGNTMMAALSSD